MFFVRYNLGWWKLAEWGETVQAWHKGGLQTSKTAKLLQLGFNGSCWWNACIVWLILRQSWQIPHEVKAPLHFTKQFTKLLYFRNETEKRQFFPTSSCVQLSPASKEAEWTIYRDDLPTIRTYHVSMVTPEGLLLMGGNGRKSVDLLKPDGSVQSSVFDLERTIEYLFFSWLYSTIMLFLAVDVG